MIATDAETLHVFAVDLPMAEAERLAADGERLSNALGAIEVEPDRAHAIDPRALADLGLPHYLIEGEGADPEAVRADETTLAAETGPLLILRPRAVRQSPEPRAPLRHVGSYRMARATPEGAPLRAAAAAEGTATGVPTAAPSPGNEKRQSGMVATVALLVALLVAFVMWLVAT
jgi:hypothetical protein